MVNINVSFVVCRIPLNAVEISISKLSSDYTPSALSKFQLLSCINANMVALCRDNEDDDLLDWIGYGKLTQLLVFPSTF